MNKRVSPIAIQSLKEALCSIYWYKSDLRGFLQSCIADTSLLGATNWNNYKRQIVTDIIDALCADQDRYLSDLDQLFHEVCKMETFYHLAQLEDGPKKVARAKAAITDLRKIVEVHDTVTRQTNKIEEYRKIEAERLQKSAAIRGKLEEIKYRYLGLISSTAPQQRGFELERILYDLFELFDLYPKASFKNTGEQIDGAFDLEGTYYLFEAKWQQALVNIQDLDAFASKVRRKLENTLGLFLSINGFSSDAITTHSIGRPVLILMTGADLMAVLEERIDFVSMLLRKRRYAAQTGSILFQVHDMFTDI